MDRIEELKKELIEHQTKLKMIQEEIFIQKALEGLKVESVNNILNDVKLITYTGTHSEGHVCVLCFKLNGVEHKIQHNQGTYSLLASSVGFFQDQMRIKVLEEIDRLLKINL